MNYKDVNPSEIRINNYLKVNGAENVIQGGGIGAIQSGYLKVKPIPITPQWLVDFGFIETKGEYYLNKFNFKVVHNEVDKLFICMFHDFASGDFIHLSAVKYVHKLQNLYYELFNEELKK